MSREEIGHEEAIDSIPAYAMGGLDPEDAAAVEQHLKRCEACRRELASYGPLRGDLGLAASDAPLPEGARERLLERARDAGSLPSENSRQDSRRPLRRVFPPPSENSHRPRRRARTPLRRLSWVTAAASLLLVLLVGGATWQLHQQNQRMNQEIASQQQTISSVVDLMERADLAVSDTRVSESGARTRVYEAREGDVGMVVFDNLPPLPEGQVYQLWMQTGEGWQSEGTFVPTDKDRGSYHELLEPDGGFEQYETVAVATAPEGGLSEPPPLSEMTVLESVGTALASAGGDVPGSNTAGDYSGLQAPVLLSSPTVPESPSAWVPATTVDQSAGPPPRDVQFRGRRTANDNEGNGPARYGYEGSE